MQQHILQPKAVQSYSSQHIDIAQDFVDRITKKKDENGDVDDFLSEIYKYVTEGESNDYS